jgi:hypothetical protein
LQAGGLGGIEKRDGSVTGVCRMITPTIKPAKGFIDVDQDLPWYLPESQTQLDLFPQQNTKTLETEAK